MSVSFRRALALLSSIFVIAAVCSAQPKLVLEKQEIDLGTVYNGTIVKARVKLTNGGTDRLFIQSIRTSCGCTTVKQPKTELKPGEADVLEIEFNSAGFRGPVTKYVHIETNDPANQNVSVSFTTTVKEEMEPVNKSTLLWFGDLAVGKPASLTYTLRNIGDSKISIKKVTKVYPKLTVQYDKKTVAPGDTVVVTVSATPNRPGYFNETVTLETDSKNQSHVPIRISYVGVTR
jgi:hypothetical protein